MPVPRLAPGRCPGRPGTGGPPMTKPTTLPPGGQQRRHVRVPLSAGQAGRAQFAVVSPTTGAVTTLADVQAVDLSLGGAGLRSGPDESPASAAAEGATVHQHPLPLRGRRSTADHSAGTAGRWRGDRDDHGTAGTGARADGPERCRRVDAALSLWRAVRSRLGRLSHPRLGRPRNLTHGTMASGRLDSPAGSPRTSSPPLGVSSETVEVVER